MTTPNDPLVSVLTPVYNNIDYLDESIGSILGQNYTNFEFIIIDDFSTDGSWDKILEYAKKDKRIIPLRNEKNLKIPKTRNISFEKARGKYLVLHDGDDVSLSHRIRTQVDFMEQYPEVGAAGSNMLVIDNSSKVVGERKYESDYKKIKNLITKLNPIPQPTVIIRSDVVKKDIGNYNEDFIRCSDYDLWIRIAKKYKITNIDEFLVQYRRSDEQGLVRNFNQSLKYTLKIQKKYLFQKEFFNPINIILWIFKHFLLILPRKAVLVILDKLFYNRKRRV